MTDARVILWGRDIGAVSWLADRETGVFQYRPEFVRSGIELAPMTMPLSAYPYEFPALARNTFKGLPGLLADSLPDKFGNALIDGWLAAQGRTADSFNPVERLCYVGRRGMGALEFEPSIVGNPTSARKVEVAALVDLANRILDERASLGGVFSGEDDRETIEDILRVGTSAGGARAKAILAWNPRTGEFRSGQLESGEGFEPWLIKFDGVSNNRDHELADPMGFGLIEFAYSKLAGLAGIAMAECRVHAEGGRHHFMTRRFDRDGKGRKLHMQSLCAMAHYDFNLPGAYAYEQAVQAIRRLGMGQDVVEEQVRRAMFNIVARNQDDHVKNIAFLMDRSGSWSLSPAFDLSYAWNPSGDWTSRHQMSLNGKRDGFSRDDLIAFGETSGLKRAKANAILDQVISAMKVWPDVASEVGVPDQRIDQIGKAHRLQF